MSNFLKDRTIIVAVNVCYSCEICCVVSNL